MTFSVADKHVHPSLYLFPPNLPWKVVIEDLNPASLIAKLKNSAFKCYDFT